MSCASNNQLSQPLSSKRPRLRARAQRKSQPSRGQRKRRCRRPAAAEAAATAEVGAAKPAAEVAGAAEGPAAPAAVNPAAAEPDVADPGVADCDVADPDVATLLFYTGEMGLATLALPPMQCDVIVDNKKTGDAYMYDAQRCLWTPVPGKSVYPLLCATLWRVLDAYQRSWDTEHHDDDDDDDDDGDSHTRRVVKLRKDVGMTLKLANVWTLMLPALFRENAAQQFNQLAHLLPVQGNLIIDLRRGKVRERTRTDMFSMECPARVLYDAETGALSTDLPLARRFFRAIMLDDDSMVAFMQKMLGYVITGEMRARCFFVWFGHGSNGKSVLAKMLRQILGEFYAVVSKDVVMANPRGRTAGAATPELVSLTRCRLAMFCEGEEHDVLNQGLLKTLSGNDAITLRPLYGKQQECRPVAKMVVQTNHLPGSNADDQAMRDRLKLVPFNARFEASAEGSTSSSSSSSSAQSRVRRADDEFIKQLVSPEGLAQVLTWCALGAQKWYADPDLSLPPSAQQRTDAYFDDQNVALQFVNQCCTRDAHAKVARSALYSRFQDWCRDQSNQVWSRQQLNKALTKKGWNHRKSRGVTSWLGLCLRRDAADDDDDDEHHDVDDNEHHDGDDDVPSDYGLAPFPRREA
jgi:P4 family phage/plasmid primase-like protien